jgi:pimeloyl-ACP methyl ester carboxylesterase
MVVDSQGARIAYDAAGRGPAVLCIQGVGVIGNGWLPQVRALSEHFRLITFDNRGIGGSSRGVERLTIEAMAADAAAIIAAERCQCVHVMGHSLGGLVAIHLASTMPARIKSLSLLCTFADGAGPTRFSWRMAALGLRSRVGTRVMRRNGMLDMILPPEYIQQVGRPRLAEQLAPLFGHDLADQPAIASQQLSAMSKYNGLSRLAGLSRIPTLVVSGAHDPIAPPRLGQRIAEGIAGARFIEFADASHALPIQCAERINRLLMEHLVAAEALVPGA